MQVQKSMATKVYKERFQVIDIRNGETVFASDSEDVTWSMIRTWKDLEQYRLDISSYFIMDKINGSPYVMPVQVWYLHNTTWDETEDIVITYCKP